jgi:hypothetical protein
LWVTKNKKTDLVEGSTPSKTEKALADIAGAGNVEAPAPTARERTLDEDDESGLTET